MEDIISELREWVSKNYNKDAAEYTWERSAGNSADCFWDGQDCGESWAAYEVGKILGMDLPEPELEDDE